LLSALSSFVRDARCKLLHVIVDAEARASVVDMVMVHEHRPDNPAPFVAFHQAYLAERTGWRSRAAHARRVHRSRRDGAEASVPDLPESPDAHDELAAFAVQLQQVLHATPRGAEGLVVVLAPSHVAAPTKFRDEVDGLIRTPALTAVRWIVVDVGPGAMSPTVVALGARAREVDARAPVGTRDAELDAIVAGRRRARPCGATAPRRGDTPTAATDPDGERRAEIGRLSLAAALAASRGEAPSAVLAQREARDIAAAAGWTDDAIVLELALGGHLVGAGSPGEAEASFQRAVDSAQSHGRHDLVATAGIGLAAVRMTRSEHASALVAYADAAVAAKRGGSEVLSVEASRLAGEAALMLRMEPQAITFLAQALAIAEASTEAPSRSCGSKAARTLALLCERRGLGGRASELRETARQLDDEARPVDDASSSNAAPAGAEAESSGAPVLVPAGPAGFAALTTDDAASLQRALVDSLDVAGSELTAILGEEELARLRARPVEHDGKPMTDEPHDDVGGRT
jgi:hypothetical protein